MAGALAALALAPAAAQALNNTSPPTISAPNPREGGVLTVNPGTWELDVGEVGPVSQSYQWFRCDSAGNNCNDTGQTGTQYTLTAADVGNTIFVRETADCALNCTPTSADSGLTPVIRTDPSNDVPPAIAGTPTDGQTLTIAGGSNVWSGSGTVDLAYEWLRCDGSGGGCAPIAGATGTSYTLQSADVGLTIRVRVTGTGGASPPQVVASAPSGIVAAAPPVNVTPPLVGGTFREGQIVGAFVGTWSGTAPISYAFRWQRCASPDPTTCNDIAGATELGYKLRAVDVNQRIRLIVVADNPAPGTSPAVASAMSTPVTRRRRPTLMSPFPTVAIGGIGRLRSTDVHILRVTGPRGAVVSVRCRGRRCPFRQVRRTIGRQRRVRIKGLERRLRLGTRIVIRVTASGAIGKYTRFRIRSLRRPARFDACLQPGASRPSRCP